mgnify:CR=1 FL=1
MIYTNREIPESSYTAREVPISEYLYRDTTSGYYRDRITCGKRYKWSELVGSWSFYHVSWRFLSGDPCTNYISRVVPS